MIHSQSESWIHLYFGFVYHLCLASELSCKQPTLSKVIQNGQITTLRCFLTFHFNEVFIWCVYYA